MKQSSLIEKVKTHTYKKTEKKIQALRTCAELARKLANTWDEQMKMLEKVLKTLK